MDSYKAFEYINKKLITPRFLQLVEKWARYDGEEFWIGDADIYVTNRGVFKTKTMLPDIKMVDGSIKVDNTHMRPFYTYYDVTQIKNTCVCSDYDTRILIAQRSLREYPESLIFPNKLWIYCIHDGNGKNKYGQHKMPSFRTLKSNFQTGKYTQYNSLLHEFCHDYQLIPFNDYTDRIFNFTGIEGDLEALDCDPDARSRSKHIIPPKRLSRKERDVLFKKLHPDADEILSKAKKN